MSIEIGKKYFHDWSISGIYSNNYFDIVSVRLRDTKKIEYSLEICEVSLLRVSQFYQSNIVDNFSFDRVNAEQIGPLRFLSSFDSDYDESYYGGEIRKLRDPHIAGFTPVYGARIAILFSGKLTLKKCS